MEPKLFSELIAKLPIKPDYTIAKKIDEIEIPFRNMKFVKKDINNLFFQIFNDFISEYQSNSNSYKNLEVVADSSMVMFVDFGEKYELTIKKTKKECFVPLGPDKTDFDDSVLTESFIDEIDRIQLLMSLVMGSTLRKTIDQIENEYGVDALQTKVVYDQIFEFWTKYSKNDFCYLSDLELDERIKLEEPELELCVLKFFFNAFKYAYIDLEKYSDKQKEAIKKIINDRSNYRWYIIFGFWLSNLFIKKHINILDFLYSDYAKIKEIMEETLSQR